MAITPADIVFRLADGGRPSVPVSKGTLWPDMSAAANADRQSDFQCMFVHNTHKSLTLYNATLTLTKVDADVAVAVDPTPARPAVAKGSVLFAPGELTFTSELVALGDLPPGHVRAVWLRRTGRNVAAGSEGYGWAVEGETFEVGK